MNRVSHDDGVIAAGMDRVHGALDERDGSFDHGGPGLLDAVSQCRESILAAAGECSRQILLILAQVVDAKMAAGDDRGQGSGSIVHANQEPGRVE